MIFWLREIIMELFGLFLKVLAILIPKQKNLVLLGAFSGKRFADNSAIIFKHILENEKQLRPVWLTNNDAVIQQVKSFGGEAYKRRSFTGIWLSLVSPVYITSHGIKDVLMFVPIKKTPHHIYVHHGIPLRKGWLDIKNAPRKSIKSTNDKIKHTDYMIAPSKLAAEQQNKLLPIGLDHFAMTGLPRNDIFFDAEINKAQYKSDFGLDKFDKIVLYGPTWRPWGATQFFPFEDYNLDDLHEFLLAENMVLVLRPHHVDLNNKEIEDFWKSIEPLSNIRLITHNICADVNLLCLISDALITDYSSMYYDYLIMDKPVIFLLYDFEKYNSEIGFYPDFKAITHGHKPQDQPSFLSALKDVAQGIDPFKNARNNLKNEFYVNLDGQSTQRVTDLIKELIG